MTSGRHSAGKPKQPPVFQWAVVCLSVFTAGVLTAMYVPDGGEPVLVASGPTAELPADRAPKPVVEVPPSETTQSQSATADAPVSETPSENSPVPEMSAQAAVDFSPAPADTPITIVGVGDILVHKQIWSQAVEDGGEAGDFLPMLAGVAPRVAAADVGVCHMEYPFAPPEGPVTYWPKRPAAPWSLAKGVADAGFDMCSTVSNHIQDQGLDGITNLLDSLDANGIAHAGAARTEEESQRITLLDVKGVRVAQLAYSYGLYDNGQPWSVNGLDVDRMLADAQRARTEGAHIVIVSLHDGEENVTAPTQRQIDIVQALAAAGTVDLVLGHHTHCVQPVEKIGDMWVAYGHGNLLTAQERKDPRSADGLITRWTFQADSSGRMRVIDAAGVPILNEDWPFRLVDLSAAAGTRTQSQEESWQRTSATVLSMGADTAGFHLLSS